MTPDAVLGGNGPQFHNLSVAPPTPIITATPIITPACHCNFWLRLLHPTVSVYTTHAPNSATLSGYELRRRPSQFVARPLTGGRHQSAASVGEGVPQVPPKTKLARGLRVRSASSRSRRGAGRSSGEPSVPTAITVTGW